MFDQNLQFSIVHSSPTLSTMTPPTLSIKETLDSLHVDKTGLHPNSVDSMRKQFGWNELPEKKKNLFLLFAHQFQNTLVYILIAALILSIALPMLQSGHDGEGYVDAVVIFAILILNALLGFIQEYKAEEAIAALRTLTSPQTRVRRGGEEHMIPSRELLPGDIVIIDTGDRISADGRLITSSHLEVNESSLTGESAPIPKDAKATSGATLAEQFHSVFAGTIVTRGSAEYVVTDIGLKTEIGKVATLVSETELPETPLARRMRMLSRTIGIVVLGLCTLVVLLGLQRDMPLLAIILLAISMAVSAVPEGLPAVVTASLAMGVRRMAGQNALVRRLDALETLGSINVICSDKTGTITENRMTVREVWLLKDNDHERYLIGQIAASCNHAELPDLGDPTEIGLLEYAKKERIDRVPIEDEEVPFTSEEKYMRTRHGERSFLKGAPEKILDLTNEESKDVRRRVSEMALQGLRVLAFAVVEEGTDKPRFVGLMAMEDAAREGVKEAIAEAKQAGIRTMMITGDNIDTALAIARQVGIEGDAMEGKDIDRLSQEELKNALEKTSVFARVSPAHKIQLLTTLKDNGHIVAMTGDGVNDAPALKGAHVGVAMGKVGTQVAKEAASIVLADDSFATIVAAIREGRRIYDNIRKFVLYLLRANFGELTFITVAMLGGLPVPYLPIHILWINLMTDGLPALALATEPGDPNIMNRPPRPPREHVFAGEWKRFILYVIAAFALPFSMFAFHLYLGYDEQYARTITFTTAIVFELFLAFTTRSPYPVWEIGLFKNRWLLGAVAVPMMLHLILLYTPLGSFFQLVPLVADDWLMILSITFAGFLVLELLKPIHVTPWLKKMKARLRTNA